MNLPYDINNLGVKEVKNYSLKYESDIEKYSSDKEFLEFLKCLEKDKRKGIQDIYNKLYRAKEKFDLDCSRVEKLYEFDRNFKGIKYVAGVDEVGRGPLAGPIVGAAVILDLNHIINYIDDSKKLKEEKREVLSKIIKESALDYNIVEISNYEIDKYGIATCNNEIFKRAIAGLKIKPDLILTDGYRIKNWNGTLNKHVIKGDSKSSSIACASIIAKVYRDELMKRYSENYPMYNFEKNMGYGTREHIEAIKTQGICEIHRRSFLSSLGY